MTLVMRKRNENGFTLLETTLATVIVFAIVGGLVLAQTYTMDRGETTREKEEQLADSMSMLSEIQQAVRMADEVLKADNGLLAIETRYFIDIDDDVEKVRYRLIGNTLYRAIADGVSAYGPDEVVLENVTSFQGKTVQIIDSFDRPDYDSLPGGVMGIFGIDGSVKTTYKVKDLGAIDNDLVDSYDAERQRLSIDSPLTKKTVTVSPPLAKEGLETAITFTPQESSVQFNAIAWGDANVDMNSVSVIFDADQGIKLRRVEGGVVQEQALSAETWSENETYEVTLKMNGNNAYAWVESVNGTFTIGPISTGTLDNKSIHFSSNSAGGQGAWDDLDIGYTFVDVSMAVDANGATLTFDSGATRRITE